MYDVSIPNHYKHVWTAVVERNKIVDMKLMLDSSGINNFTQLVLNEYAVYILSVG